MVLFTIRLAGLIWEMWAKTSGSQAAANTLLVWLEGVLRLWLSLSCR